MNKPAVSLLCLLCPLIMTAGFASAQETQTPSETQESPSVETSSGGTATIDLDAIQQQAAQAIWNARVERSKNFRTDLLQKKGELTELEAKLLSLRTERDVLRQECASAIRTASKVSLFKASLNCYQEELEIDLALHEAQREWIEKSPGVTDDVRWLAITRADLLIEALKVVVGAMESDVYEEIGELEETKANLYANYRKPYWVMLSRVTADRMLTWVAAIMTRIADVSEKEQLTASEAKTLIEGLNCLSQEEILLQSVLRSQDVSDARNQLADARLKLEECLTHLRKIEQLRIDKDEEVRRAAEEERLRQEAELEAQKSILSRRLRRRLSEEFRIEGAITNIEEEEGSAQSSSVSSASSQSTETGSTLSRRLRRRLGDSFRINEE